MGQNPVNIKKQTTNQNIPDITLGQNPVKIKNSRKSKDS
jgi:hypothetical protein